MLSLVLLFYSCLLFTVIGFQVRLSFYFSLLHWVGWYSIVCFLVNAVYVSMDFYLLVFVFYLL